MDLTFYNGDHCVSFGRGTVANQRDSSGRVVMTGVKNTWTDWGLIPASKPVISPPAVKVKQVDLPGCYGILDLSTVLTGYPLYSNRTGSLEFIVRPDRSFEGTKMTVMNYLHGQSMNMYLDDDPDHYYTGIFTVTGLKADSKINGITINYDLYPFRRSLWKSDEDWLWDPFNFETGLARNWSALAVDGSLTLSITDCIEPVTPVFTPSKTMTLVHRYTAYDGTSKSSSYSLSTANTAYSPLTFKPGTNTLVFTCSGSGTVHIAYRGGVL